jgi:hypothetical protein
MTASTSPDHSTLTEVLAGYAAAGFDGSFTVDDECIRCLTCHVATPPSEVEIQSLRRLEGASDPADMAAVLAVACPACGQRATIVLRYGPEASPAEAELLQRARDGRFTEGVLPPASAPDEESVERTEGGRPPR